MVLAPRTRFPFLCSLYFCAFSIACMSNPKCSVNFWSSDAMTANVRDDEILSSDFHDLFSRNSFPLITCCAQRIIISGVSGIGTKRNRINEPTLKAMDQSNSLRTNLRKRLQSHQL